MTERSKQPPLSIDVGIKAGLNLKAEIPKTSMGRLVDALTDSIRPFTEARGLRADQIRLQREDILIDIARRARARAEIENITLNPVSTKMLIPFLEKASTEDLDKEMRDRWAALLLSASKEYHARHLTFVDILGRLSSDEIRILEETAFSYPSFPEISYPGGHIEGNHWIVEAMMRDLASEPPPTESFEEEYEHSRARYDDYIRKNKFIYGSIMYATIRCRGGMFYFYEDLGREPGRRSIEILERERLMQVERVKHSEMECGYFNLTYLGISFVQDCAPHANLMAARPRSEPVYTLPEE